jgi:hypothetical protein
MSLLPLGLLSQGGGAAGQVGFQLISTTLISSTTSSVTFSAIPATFKHLQIRVVGRYTSVATLSNLTLRFNGDTGANYGYQSMRGQSTTISSAAPGAYQTYLLTGDMPASQASSSGFGTSFIDVIDYANTSKITTTKTFGGNGATQDVFAFNGTWNSTAIVSSILVNDANTSASFAAGTRISLYGRGN